MVLTLSILPRRPSPHRLDAGAALLALQVAHLGAERRLGGDAADRAHGGGLDEFDEAFECVGAVALLGVRWRWAVMISTPSRVSRWPASRSSRARTSWVSEGE